MRDMLSIDDFIHEFSEYSNMTKKDIRYFISSLKDFMYLAIDEQVTMKTGVFELYYSTMKSRDTVKVGTKDVMVHLPPSKKARLRLPNRQRKAQSEANKIYKDLLIKEEEKHLTEYE